METYVRPSSIEDALRLRAAGATILAGGTDYWPVRVTRPVGDGDDQVILDLGAMPALRQITSDGDAHRIGALVDWTSLADAPLPPAFAALQAAAREIGGRQVQNRGTIGGNLCNASPAADGVPPLLVLDAHVELASTRGRRLLPLSQFLLGPRRTALQRDEILTAIVLPNAAVRGRSAFMKLGSRKYQLISIVMAAATIDTGDDGRVRHAAIAVGACSPVALRLAALERDLIGTRLGEIDRRVTEAHLGALAPIDDLRADAAYRRDAAGVLVRRLLRSFGAAS